MIRFIFDRDKGFIQQRVASGSTTVNIDSESIQEYMMRTMGFQLLGGLTYSNTVFVDQVSGDNSTGQRGTGRAFATISAALSAARPNDLVFVWPGTYNESIVMPDNVSVRGLSSNATFLKQLNVTASTDLLKMGNNSRWEDISLELTSQQHLTLRGAVFSGSSTVNSIIKVATIIVDNSSASMNGTSNVYAVHVTGTANIVSYTPNLTDSALFVNSVGSGSKRGVLIDSNNRFDMASNFIKTSIISGSAGTAISIETNHPQAICFAQSTTLSGATADISQTTGSLQVAGTGFLTKNANGKTFDANGIHPELMIWADPGALPPNTTRYLRPGSEAVTTSEIRVRIPQAAIVKDLSLNARIAPGVTIDTFTVRKNGVDTVVSATLSGSQTMSTSGNVSVAFAKGDEISIKAVTGVSTNIQDIVVGVTLY